MRRLLVVVLLAGIAGCLFWQPLLRTVARCWVVEQPVEHADAIVLATGTRDVLFAEALGWFQNGRAPRIVLLDSETRPTDRAGITEPARAVRLRQLREAGVPEKSVFLVGHELTCLHEEFTALRDWAQSNHVQRVLLPTDPFATRRVEWLGRRLLQPTGVLARVVPVDVPDYTVAEWWRKEAGLVAFENEWVLLPYYWSRY